VVTRSWEDVDYRGFGPIIIALSLFLLGDMAVALLTGVLWAIIVALPYASVVPIYHYAVARAKHKTLAGFGVLAIFAITANLLIGFCVQLAPPPLASLLIPEYTFGVCIILFIGAILSERFLKPKLKSRT